MPPEMKNLKTADLSDLHHPDLQYCTPGFISYGGWKRFYGRISTVKCFEDNSLVKEALADAGGGRVLVVDAGGSRRCAMLGDLLAAQAVANGWAGVVMYGMVRDTREIAEMPLGVLALGAHPLKSVKRGVGERDVEVSFAAVRFRSGEHFYADEDGIIVAGRAILP
ncbi:MAG: ribonuclease E activity regulator RraA [Pseudomonadota bacterium]|nr:ribonuclease E activity regulator RraA [Pseudomonadota bacterium]